MINLVPIACINDYVIITTVMAAIITTMIAIMIGTINTNCHNCCKSKPGRIISVIIRRSIGHISW